MMNGRLYDGDTLDQVWPEQVTAGPFYWQRGGSAGGGVSHTVTPGLDRFVSPGST